MMMVVTWYGMVICKSFLCQDGIDQSSAASALFKRTSEVQLALLERVEVGEGVVDEVCREPHLVCVIFGGSWDCVPVGRFARVRRGSGSGSGLLSRRAIAPPGWCFVVFGLCGREFAMRSRGRGAALQGPQG